MMRKILTLVAVVLLVSSAQGALDDGLIGYWDFDSGSGSTALDSSGNGFDGSITGASWTEGKIGSALSFDGSDDKVTISDTSKLEGMEQITVAAWVKLDGDQGDWKGIAVKDGAYRLLIPGNGVGSEWNIRDSTGSRVKIFGDNDISEGNWHYQVGVFNGSDMRLYVDGILLASDSNPGTVNSNNNNIYVGSLDGGSHFFDGKIDQVRIYDRALSQSEIEQLIDRAESICDRRGPKNECVVNSEKNISGQNESIENVFLSERSAIFNSPSGQARISVSNSSIISGLWLGDFNITSREITVTPGAKFVPENRIILDKK